MSSSNPTDRMHVVIVGGGYGGCALAMKLLKKCKVTIVDPKDCLIHNISALRCCVEPKYLNKLFIPYAETFGDSFVCGKVVGINQASSSIKLEDGQEIAYTHLVLATGTTGPFPGKVTDQYPALKRSEGMRIYESIYKDICEAESIVCVGGGAVGTELAGEIKTDFPAKSVTLIHSSEILASRGLQVKAQAKVKSSLTKKGINLVLAERVSNLGDLQLNKFSRGQILKTESGKEITADLIFPCTGLKVATNVFRDALEDSMNERGQMRVDKYFRVAETEKIYAIGDITDIEEEKLAYAAGLHADLLAKNLISAKKGRKLVPYKTDGFAMVISIGRNGGVGEYKGHVMGGFLTKTLKSKDLFWSKYWGMMNQKPQSK